MRRYLPADGILLTTKAEVPGKPGKPGITGTTVRWKAERLHLGSKAYLPAIEIGNLDFGVL